MTCLWILIKSHCFEKCTGNGKIFHTTSLSRYFLLFENSSEAPVLHRESHHSLCWYFLSFNPGVLPSRSVWGEDCSCHRHSRVADSLLHPGHWGNSLAITIFPRAPSWCFKQIASVNFDWMLLLPQQTRHKVNINSSRGETFLHKETILTVSDQSQENSIQQKRDKYSVRKRL